MALAAAQMIMPTSNDAEDIILDGCIQNARLGMECLACQHELKELRKTRQKAIEKHNDLKCEYEQRMQQASRILKKDIYGNKSLEHYMYAVQIQHDIWPSLYIIRKEAEVIQRRRQLQLLDTYMELLKLHNTEMHSHMKDARDLEMKALEELQTLAREVWRQLRVVVEKNIESYVNLDHDKSSNNKQRIHQRRSSLERVRTFSASKTHCHSASLSKFSKAPDVKAVFEMGIRKQNKVKSKLRIINSGAA